MVKRIKVIRVITHKELIYAAYRWVLKNTRCGVAFKELYTAACNGEYPDVIGFRGWGHSVLVECKASRSDFFADRKKSFRKNPDSGMGSLRFYCCPTEMIGVDELPEGWGLIYVNKNLKATCVHKCIKTFKKDLLSEHAMMYSALRRLHIRGRIDEIYSDKPSVNQGDLIL